MRVLMRRHYDTLKPVDEEGLRILGRVPQGSIIPVEIRRARSVRQNSYFWVLMTKVAESHPRYNTPELVKNVCCIGVGHADVVISDKGRVWYAIKSTNFDSMDADEFRAFFDNVIRFLEERIIPGIPAGALRDEVEAALAGTTAAVAPADRRRDS